MKTIYKIAKTELLTLFYSPIAWFLMIIFLIQCAYVYLYALGSNATTMEIGGIGLEYMADLTDRIFTSPYGLFSTVMQKLYLYIPLLTMSLISRETSSGTIKLLYSSPVDIRQIIIGKYLAMLVYSLILILIISMFVIDGMFHIVSPDIGMLFSAILGLYLVLCAYAAIGLFMSCLTTYQVVAALSTFIMIGALSYIGNLWQGIDFIRDLTFFLSISGRAENMLTGLITTKDVIYFLVIIYIFLGLSIYKLKAGIESKPVFVKIRRYAVIVLSALIVGYISSRPILIGYWDVTVNKTHTVTPNVRKILKDLGDEPLEVTSYNNLLGGNLWSTFTSEYRNKDLARWEPYMRFKSNIRFKYVEYWDKPLDQSYYSQTYPGMTDKQVAEKIAKGYKIKLSNLLSPSQIHKEINLEPELNRYVMQLKYKGRTTFLRVFNDQQVWPGEAEIGAAFKRLMAAEIPKIAFLTGNLERDINKEGDREYQTLTKLSTYRKALVNQGFDVDTLSLGTLDIPTDVSIVVVADPKVDFSAPQLAALRRYIDRGGNLLIAGEPGKQSVLNLLLKEIGVEMENGTIVQPSRDHSPDMLKLKITPELAGFSASMKEMMEIGIPVTFAGSTALSYGNTSPFTIKPILIGGSDDSWLKKDKLVADSAAVTFSAVNGDIKKNHPTAISMVRTVGNKQQRIIVSGDADFMSNSVLRNYGINSVLSTSFFSWLSNGAFPIDAHRPDSKDNRVKISSDGVAFLKIVYMYVIPGLLLAFGAILLIRRKRK